MVERKSKPRKKADEDDEPTGVKAVKQSPWFLLLIVFLIIIGVIALLFGLSRFLSQA